MTPKLGTSISKAGYLIYKMGDFSSSDAIHRSAAAPPSLSCKAALMWGAQGVPQNSKGLQPQHGTPGREQQGRQSRRPPAYTAAGPVPVLRPRSVHPSQPAPSRGAPPPPAISWTRSAHQMGVRFMLVHIAFCTLTCAPMLSSPLPTAAAPNQ